MERVQNNMFRVFLFSVLFTFVAEPANFTKTGTAKPVGTTKSTGSIKPTESARPRNGVRRENSEQGVNESKTETMYANAKARLEALWGKKWFKYGVVPTSIVAMACGLGHYFGVTGLLYSWLIIQSENAKEPNIEGDGGDQKEEGNVKVEELVDNETSDGNEDVVPKGDEEKASADGPDGDGEGQSGGDENIEEEKKNESYFVRMNEFLSNTKVKSPAEEEDAGYDFGSPF